MDFGKVISSLGKGINKGLTFLYALNGLPKSAKTDFILRNLTYAIQTQKETKIPASVTLAQAALESAWGKSAPGNNFFGIKAFNTWKGPTQLLWTHEFINGRMQRVQRKFRKYPSPYECFLDHAKIIVNGPLKRALDHTGYAFDFVRSLQNGVRKYATDPNYLSKVMTIIREFNLENFDKL